MSTVVRSIWKSEQVAVKIPSASSGVQLFFPDDQYIRDVQLMSLDFTPNLNEFSGGSQQKLPDGGLVLNSVIAAFMYLTLESYDGNQFVRNEPLMKYCPYWNGKLAVNIADQFKGQRVNWPKSFIYVATGAPSAGADQWALFNIHFADRNVARMKKDLSTGFNQKT